MNVNKWKLKVLDERLQRYRKFHIKILNFSGDVYFKIFHGLSFIFLVENNEQSNQPCPRPGLALLSTFILDPLDTVMS